MKDMCTLIIPSTDSAKDMWSYYSAFQKMYWNDCPFEIVLINETFPLPDKNTSFCFNKQILVNENKWSDMVKEGVKKVKTKYIILNFEDQWPKRKINNDRIIKALEMMEINELGCMQIFKKYKNVSGEYIEILFGEAYRMSCSTSIWNREFLIECLDAGESPWHFETCGSYRENTNIMRVFAMSYPAFPFINALRKGVIRREAVRFAKKNNIILSTNRKRQNIYEEIVERAKNIVYDFAPNLIIETKKKVKKGY